MRYPNRHNAPILVLMTIAFCFFCQLAAAEPLEFDGLIEPYRTIQIGSPTPGVLDEVRVDRGYRVKKGQVLARLQSEVERATMAYAEARAEILTTIRTSEVRLAYNIRTHDRLQKLYREDVTPLQEKDEAETNVALTELELAKAQEDLRLAELEYARAKAVVERMTIRSPISGIVTKRLMSPGEYVEDKTIVEVARIDPLNVEVFVPVEYLGAIKQGMTAAVIPKGPPEEAIGGPYTAKVVIVDKIVDAASGTFGVRLELPNPDYRLPAGLGCTVRFSAAE